MADQAGPAPKFLVEDIVAITVNIQGVRDIKVYVEIRQARYSSVLKSWEYRVCAASLSAFTGIMWVKEEGLGKIDHPKGSKVVIHAGRNGKHEVEGVVEEVIIGEQENELGYKVKIEQTLTITDDDILN